MVAQMQKVFESGQRFQLRWYQQEAVDAGLAFFRGKSKQNGILVLPTGAGKSLVIANIAMQLGGKTLVFSPSQEILTQNAEKIRAYGFEPGVWSASLGRKDRREITLATIGSVDKCPELFADVDNVLIDECHLVNAKLGMYKRFLEALKKKKLLGLSALPARLSSDNVGGSMLKFLTRTRPKIFGEVVYHVQGKVLWDQGYLAKLEYKEIKGFDKSQVQTNSTGADYDDDSVQKHLFEINFRDKIVKVVKRCLEVGRKNVLVFTRFISDADYVVEQIPGAALITGKTTDSMRVSILRKFKAGELRVVCNVGVLTTGFDYPELDTVVIARPTKSLSLYYQICGRPMRPHPEKASAWIVDMVGLVQQFGRVEDLELRREGNAWAVWSGSDQLSNVYFDPDFKPRFVKSSWKKKWGRKAA